MRRRVVECDGASESSEEYFSNSDIPIAVVTSKQQKKKNKLSEKSYNSNYIEKNGVQYNVKCNQGTNQQPHKLCA